MGRIHSQFSVSCFLFTSSVPAGGDVCCISAPPNAFPRRWLPFSPSPREGCRTGEPGTENEWEESIHNSLLPVSCSPVPVRRGLTRSLAVGCLFALPLHGPAGAFFLGTIQGLLPEVLLALLDLPELVDHRVEVPELAQAGDQHLDVALDPLLLLQDGVQGLGL